MHVWLSKIDGSGGADPLGGIVNPATDLEIGQILGQDVNIAPGGTVTIKQMLQIPKTLVEQQGSTYRILVQVTPSADSTISERFDDDGVSFDSRQHAWYNAFGTFTIAGTGSRIDAKLTYKEADGNVVQLGSDSTAFGQINWDGIDADLSLLKTSALSAISVKVLNPSKGDGLVDLDDVELLRFVNSLNLTKTSLTGSVSAARGIYDLRLGNVSGGGTLSLGAFPLGKTGSSTQVSLRQVSDFSIDSLAPISSITATQWLDPSGGSLIEAPALGSLTITKGDFEADIYLTSGATLDSLKVAGFVRESLVRTSGNIGTIDVGGLDQADIYAGVNSRPQSAADFVARTTIDSLIVRGVAGSSKAFIDSNVAAAEIGSVDLLKIDGASGTGAFGIVADAIKSYNRNGVFAVGDEEGPATLDVIGHYRLRIL